MLFVADAEGRLTRCSQGLAARFEAHLGKDATLASLVADDEREALDAWLRELSEAEGPVTKELRVPDEGGRARARWQAWRVPSGAIHGQLELLPPPDPLPRLEHAFLDKLMSTLDVALWAVDRDGTFLFQDGKALESSTGLRPGQLLGQNIFDVYPPEYLEPLRRALGGETVHYATDAHNIHWDTWNIPVGDEGGAPEYCIGVSVDVTASVRAKQELEQQLETIRLQQRAINELSTPLIQVWNHVLAVPLIGIMDSGRTNELSERLLAEVGRLAVRFAILDLTGVEVLDSSSASHVLRLLASLRLLGVEAMITGISPSIAQTMVALDIELGAIQTYRTLREALRYCMKSLLEHQA